MNPKLKEELDPIQTAETMLKARKVALRDSAIAECRRIINTLGLTPAQLFGNALKSDDRKRFVYVNPDDPTQTCSNLGRKPAWYTNLRKEGREIPIRF